MFSATVLAMALATSHAAASDTSQHVLRHHPQGQLFQELQNDYTQATPRWLLVYINAWAIPEAAAIRADEQTFADLVQEVKERTNKEVFLQEPKLEDPSTWMFFNFSAKSLLHDAARFQSTYSLSAMRTLLRYTNDPDVDAMAVTHKMAQTPLQIAIRQYALAHGTKRHTTWAAHTQEDLERTLECIRLLLEAGASTRTKSTVQNPKDAIQLAQWLCNARLCSQADTATILSLLEQYRSRAVLRAHARLRAKVQARSRARNTTEYR